MQVVAGFLVSFRFSLLGMVFAAACGFSLPDLPAMEKDEGEVGFVPSSVLMPGTA